VTTVAPALLALAAPVRLALAALPAVGRRSLGRALHRPVVRLLAHPAVAVPLAAATMVLVHLTGAFDAAAGSPPLHGLEHAALFWTALVAWMAVLGVDPLPSTPDAVSALAWISVSMVAMTGVGATLATAEHARYAHYPSLADQHDAGTVMWLGGAAILVPAAIAVAMWALEREERRQRRREAATE
jgi:cytochrome c oxidase assembly factor CtaG